MNIHVYRPAFKFVFNLLCKAFTTFANVSFSDAILRACVTCCAAAKRKEHEQYALMSNIFPQCTTFQDGGRRFHNENVLFLKLNVKSFEKSQTTYCQQKGYASYTLEEVGKQISKNRLNRLKAAKELLMTLAIS
jgi:TPP-dependent trihydroxycyclohexane-1,2-dione (THcHDO) dehydratase